MISGEPASAGSIMEVSNEDAQILIGLKKAVEYKEEPVAPPAQPPAKEESAAPAKKTTTRRSTK